MSNPMTARKITNSFLDVRLVSLASWRMAGEISPRDHGGPYVVLQEGCAPDDINMVVNEYLLGRSGKWLSLSHFFHLPVPERRAEFVFGTAGEVMKMMSDLPTEVQMFGRPDRVTAPSATPANDEMAAAFQAGKAKGAA